MRHPLEPHRPFPPHPVVIASDYRPPQPDYTLAEYHYHAAPPAASVAPPQPSRNKTGWLAVVFLLGIVSVIAWKFAPGQPAAVLPPPVLPSSPGWWWEGVWVAENGNLPRLELRPLGEGLTGQIVQHYSSGYVMALPVLAGAMTPENALIFRVEGKSTSPHADFYALRPEADGSASLFLLAAPPPGKPISAVLLPDLAKAHRRIARMVRN